MSAVLLHLCLFCASMVSFQTREPWFSETLWLFVYEPFKPTFDVYQKRPMAVTDNLLGGIASGRRFVRKGMSYILFSEL